MWRRFQKLWSNIREGLWFLPGVILAVCVVLAYVALTLDLRYDVWIGKHHPQVFGVSASGAYSILTAIASSMVTVAGVVFSITMVALSLAANQYSPRTLRNYMRDRASQVTLGVFTGSFAYALVVLRMIRGGPNQFVPSIAVLGGIALAIASVGLFIYFVHHIAVSLTAPHFVSMIVDETIASLERLYRTEDGASAGSDAPPPASGEDNWHDVPSEETGYLQSIDLDSLLRFAEERSLELEVCWKVGAFIARSEPLLRCRCEQPLSSDAASELNRMFVLMGFRTIHQDPGHGIRQIVDVALKALSPGVNDSATATTCIDYLAAVLMPFADRPDPGCRYFRNGSLRLTTRTVTFSGLVEEAFAPIVSAAPDNAEILDQILGVVNRIHARVGGEARAAALRQIVLKVREAALNQVRLRSDRERVGDRATRLLECWSEAVAHEVTCQ